MQYFTVHKYKSAVKIRQLFSQQKKKVVVVVQWNGSTTSTTTMLNKHQIKEAIHWKRKEIWQSCRSKREKLCFECCFFLILVMKFSSGEVSRVENQCGQIALQNKFSQTQLCAPTFDSKPGVPRCLLSSCKSALLFFFSSTMTIISSSPSPSDVPLV